MILAIGRPRARATREGTSLLAAREELEAGVPRLYRIRMLAPYEVSYIGFPQGTPHVKVS